MIPIRDNISTRGRPWMLYLILAVNVAVFFYQVRLPMAELRQMVEVYGVVPARIGSPLMLLFPSQWSALVPLVTAQFLHGGWFHLGSNMLYLWIFGDDVECSMGSLRFLLFYLLTGIAGNLAHVLTNLGSGIPVIGASGAVAGILGAYLISFPRARVLTLVPLGFFLTMVEIPAVIFLGFWFVLQLASGLSAVVGAESVAWWAHIGGFVSGVILILWFRRNGRPGSRYDRTAPYDGRYRRSGSHHGARYR